MVARPLLSFPSIQGAEKILVLRRDSPEICLCWVLMRFDDAVVFPACYMLLVMIFERRRVVIETCFRISQENPPEKSPQKSRIIISHVFFSLNDC